VDDTTRYSYEQSSFANREAEEIHHTKEVAGTYSQINNFKILQLFLTAWC